MCRSVRVRKLARELGDTGLDQSGGRGPAIQLRRSGPRPSTGRSRNPQKPLPPSLRRHSRPTLSDAQGPFALWTPTRPCSLSRPPGAAGLLRLRLRGRALRPSFPLLPRLHCRRCRRRVHPGGFGSPNPGTRGSPGGAPTQTRRRRGARSPRPGRGRLRGRERAARGADPRGGHRGPGARVLPSSPYLPRPRAHPGPPPWRASENPGGGQGGTVARGRVPPGPRLQAPGPRGRAPPAPSGRAPAVQRGAARLGRSSGAVPAPGGPAPHTCLCPAPGDVAPSDWRAGGAEAGELTAAPRHWPGRRTRAVAGRRRYPEPSLSTRGEWSRAGRARLLWGPGRAGPRRRRRKTGRRGASAASGGRAPRVP